MREAGAPSTGGVASVLSGVCPPHLGYSCSHYPRSRATLAKLGGKAKDALEGGPSTKRGQGHYRGRDTPKDTPALGLRGAAVGAIPLRLPPLRLSLCGPSLTSSPGRFPPKGMVTQRPQTRRAPA